MYHIGQNTLKLVSRNEGKIKAFESCLDLRAWSHDYDVRSRYLRDWIKIDMPVCVLPVHTLATFLRTMTCRNYRRTPRCHAECRSKILIDSISMSCEAIKRTLKDQGSFDKYFEEEEFETVNWPCERCLETLKSIKMFWKIIVEKIFRLNIFKNNYFDTPRNESSIRNISREWQKEIIQEVMVVKNMTPIKSYNTTNAWKKNKKDAQRKDKSMELIDGEKFQEKDIEIDSKILKTIGPKRKTNRYTTARIKTFNAACDTCGSQIEEIKLYKNDLARLQHHIENQKQEFDKLKEENASLKIELKKAYKESWRTNNKPFIINADETSALIPYENCADENFEDYPTKTIDSEMIITVKNCRNRSYKNISILQVLHKTNLSIHNDINLIGNNCKENPIELLKKVHSTFGALVEREIILSARGNCSKETDINATFWSASATNTKSAPSISISKHSTKPEIYFPNP